MNRKTALNRGAGSLVNGLLREHLAGRLNHCRTGSTNMNDARRLELRTEVLKRGELT